MCDDFFHVVCVPNTLDERLRSPIAQPSGSPILDNAPSHASRLAGEHYTTVLHSTVEFQPHTFDPRVS